MRSRHLCILHIRQGQSKRGDEQSLQTWLDGEAPDCLAHVAVDANNAVLGLSLIRLREEMLSHESSAHLEVLAVAREAEGYWPSADCGSRKCSPRAGRVDHDVTRIREQHLRTPRL